MSTYLVTGGAGFIGSNICDKLLEQGHKVKIIDNFFSGKRENIEHIKDDVELVEGDIRDEAAVAKAVAGADYVLHQAALRSVPKSVEDPISYNDVNVTGMLKLLVAARDAGVKRFVFASSSSVYGESERFPQTEKDLPLLISPYAANKLTGEFYLRVFNKMYGLETVALRYFNVFGPRQDIGSEYAVVIPKFIMSILHDEQPPVHGDGEQTRDFTFVDNVVQANILASTVEGIECEVFNVACAETNRVLDIVEVVNNILNKDIKPAFQPARAGDIRHTKADITKIVNTLGFKPTIGFEEGLSKTIDWFSKYQG